VAVRGARKGREDRFFCCKLLGKGVISGSGGVLFFLSFSAVFNQSQCQEWERGGGGVARQPEMREQRGCIRGISTSQLGWY